MTILTDQARKTLARTLRVVSILTMVGFLIVMAGSEESMTGNPKWLIFTAALMLNHVALTLNPRVRTRRVATQN